MMATLKIYWLFVLINFISIVSFGSPKLNSSKILPEQAVTKVSIKKYGATGDGSTDDSRAIQSAFSSNADPNTYFVFPKGIYVIGNTLNTTRNNIHLLFEAGAVLKLIADDKGAIAVAHNGFSIENAAITGTGKSSRDLYKGFGIFLSGASNCSIKNCRFTNISGVNILMLRSGNTGCTNNLISGNVISNPALQLKAGYDASCILMGYSGVGYAHNANTIINNIIDGAKVINHGIAFIGHGSNNIIKGNTVKNCLRYGIVLYESKMDRNTLTNNSVLNNTVSNIGAVSGTTNNMGMGIYLMKCHSSTVSGNLLNNVLVNSDDSETLLRGAIALNGAYRCTVTNNTINNSGRYGIAGAYIYYTNILNNVIDSTGNSAIYLISSSFNKIQSNQFKNIKGTVIKGFFQNTGDTEYGKNGSLTDFYNVATGNNIEISNNKFYGDNPQLLYFYGPAANKNASLVRSATGAITGAMQNNQITNNKIYGSRRSAEKLFVITGSKAASNKVDGNVFYP